MGLNFLLFGLHHGVGVATVHYYTLWLKKRLGKGLLLYNRSGAIRCLAMLVTFIYVSLGFFFFENTWADMKTVIAAFPGSLTNGAGVTFRLW